MIQYAPDLFDGLEVPDGMDASAIVFEICKTCAGLSLIYNNPEFMKVAIAHWNYCNLTIWEKLYATTQLDYNPIWNKDGTIQIDTTYGETNSETTIGQRDGYTENQVAGFDSATYTDSDKATGHSDEATDSAKIEEHKDSITRTEQGNIGITTTQQMIKEEREVSLFNIYKVIAEDFKKEFCIMIY